MNCAAFLQSEKNYIFLFCILDDFYFLQWMLSILMFVSLATWHLICGTAVANTASMRVILTRKEILFSGMLRCWSMSSTSTRVIWRMILHFSMEFLKRWSRTAPTHLYLFWFIKWISSRKKTESALSWKDLHWFKADHNSKIETNEYAIIILLRIFLSIWIFSFNYFSDSRWNVSPLLYGTRHFTGTITALYITYIHQYFIFL